MRGTSFDRLVKGDIAEILIYDRALPDGERQNVEQYLSDMWGLTSSRGAVQTRIADAPQGAQRTKRESREGPPSLSAHRLATCS